jgi:hypothetical protein
MQTLLKPMAKLLVPRLLRHEWMDMRAGEAAHRLEKRMAGIQCSGTTGTWTERMFVNMADFTAVASTSSETSLLSGGNNEQPVIPALFFFNKQGHHRTIKATARGVLSTTSTPSIIFQWRFGTTSGPSYLSGTSVGVSGSITTQSGVTNKWWECNLELQCNTTGIGTGNTVLSGCGNVKSPGGFASPFDYPIEPTTPDTGTWTSLIDNSLTYYVNLSVTWGTSSASNTITCKQLLMEGHN